MPRTAQSQVSAQPRNFPLARTAHISLCLASMLFFSACQSQTSPPPAAKAPAVLPANAALQAEADLHKRILAEIGGAACASHAQCRTVPVGVKACGGPQAWLAWSTSVSREATLTALAEQLALLQKQRHAQSGVASTCQYIADPGAQCQAQRCTLRVPDTMQ